MTSLKDSVKVVSNLIDDIAAEFHVSAGDVVVETTEAPDYIYFKVTTRPAKLAEDNWTDADYQEFCKKNNLHAGIFFNADNTVTFYMNVL